MDTLDTMSPTRVSRVESVKNPEVNRALFQLYGNLIHPLSEMEQTMDQISSAEMELALNKGKVKFPLSDSIFHAVHIFPKAYLLVFIVIFALAHVIEALDDMGILQGLCFVGVVAAVASLLWCFVIASALNKSENKSREKAYEAAFLRLSELNRSLDGQVDRIKNRTVQLQQNLLEQERRNSEKLDQIAYNQLCMMEQLDGISRDLWW